MGQNHCYNSTSLGFFLQNTLDWIQLHCFLQQSNFIGLMSPISCLQSLKLSERSHIFQYNCP